MTVFHKVSGAPLFIGAVIIVARSVGQIQPCEVCFEPLLVLDFERPFPFPEVLFRTDLLRSPMTSARFTRRSSIMFWRSRQARHITFRFLPKVPSVRLGRAGRGRCR